MVHGHLAHRPPPKIWSNVSLAAHGDLALERAEDLAQDRSRRGTNIWPLSVPTFGAYLSRRCTEIWPLGVPKIWCKIAPGGHGDLALERVNVWSISVPAVHGDLILERAEDLEQDPSRRGTDVGPLERVTDLEQYISDGVWGSGP